MLMGFSFDPNRYLEVWKPVIGPSLASEWAAVATMLTAITVDFFIIRAVWRRASRQPHAWSVIPPERPRETSGALGATAFFFACLSALIPAASVCQSAYFHWLKPGVDPWLSPQAQEIMSWLTLVAALLAIVPGLAARKSRPGTAALIIGGYNLAIWLFFFLGAHLPSENNAQGWAPAPGYGPIIERVVTDGINLETGAQMLLPVPHPISPAASLEFANQLMHSPTGGGALTWAREQRLDVIAINRTLWGVDIQRLPLESPDWRALPATSLAGKLRAYTGETKAPSLWVLSGTGASTFVFQTRDGILGVLEIVGDAIPAGVKIRYKLAQSPVTIGAHGSAPVAAAPAAPKSELPTAAAAFGPVMERVLPIGSPDGTEKQRYYFHFQSGETRIGHRGNDLTPAEAAENLELYGHPGWIDIDPVWFPGGGVDIMGWSCVFRRDLPGLTWSSLTAETTVKTMRENGRGSSNVDAELKDIPITCLFKTSGGAVGIMEILGIVDDERGYRDDDGQGHGIKFRYKLVQQPAGEPSPHQ